MLQQGEQGHGREALVDDADQRLQQAGGRRVAKRRARRIVDVDVPAPELGGDPAREAAVRRHQGGGLALFLQDPAQRQGNDQCLLMRRRAVGARHVLERGSERADPFLGGLGRAHQLGDQQMPRRACAARPVGNVAPLAPQRLQELAQAELRMGLVEFHPASIVHVAVEAGQHDLALRQAGDDRQQLARGRLRAGGAGGDHRRGRRLLAPAHRLGADRLGAPLDGVDLAAFGQHPRPCFADDGEELQGALPVAGEVALDQAFQPVEGDAFDGELVEQSAELARQRQGLRGRLGNGLLAVGEGRDQLCQQRVALGGLDGGRQGERAAVTRRHLPFAFVDIAQRRHARQDRGLAVGGAQEGLAQRPHRTAGRQQDQHVGQRQRIAAILRQHAHRQLVGEATVDGDGEDAHPGTLVRQHALRRGERLGRADMEPVAVMDHAVQPAFGLGAMPELQQGETGHRANRGTGADGRSRRWRRHRARAAPGRDGAAGRAAR